MAEIKNSAEALDASKAAFADPEMTHYFNRWRVAYESAKRKCGIQNAEDLCEDAELHGKFWQTFWEQLPSHRDIRTAPFFTVCRLGEWYCFGDR